MHIHIDPVGGLAGDMFVAAMLDAFPSLEKVVQDAVRAAGLPDRFRCDLTPHKDHALSGKRFLVRENGSHDHAPDHHHSHRPFAEIRAAIGTASLEPGVRDHTLAIFTFLAEAEAQVHGATPDTVSFHELGEWDSIADIVAASAIIHALSPATWSLGPLPLGAGFVKSAHGLLPVPAPATALLLRGLNVREDGIGGERVTPTGAAIARRLVSLAGPAPRDRTMLGTGLGFGLRVLPGISNCVRVLVFDTLAPSSTPAADSVVSLEFEIDDQTPEDLAIGLDHIRSHQDVLDVVQTPAFGKKGRMAISVRVLCRSAGEEAVSALCFEETTTLGIRVLEVRRRTLARSVSASDVAGREFRLKHAQRGLSVTTKVESGDLKDVRGHAERERLRRAAETGSRNP